jgi:iron uptake system EfeUOB component EfeO/EfeM
MNDDELRGLFEETRRHFDVVAERLERRIDAVAESVTVLDEKLDRRIDDVEQRMDRGFAETQAMIKFSHAELDRRVRALEQAMSDLQSRVEKLESITH